MRKYKSVHDVILYAEVQEKTTFNQVLADWALVHIFVQQITGEALPFFVTVKDMMHEN